MKRVASLSAALIVSGAVFACSNGSSNTGGAGGGGGESSTHTLSTSHTAGGGGGSATTSSNLGHALTGTVTVQPLASGDTATIAISAKDGAGTETTGTADGSGAFSLDASGLSGPYLVRATVTIGTLSYALYSLAQGAGVGNVNALTTVVVMNALGGADPAATYATPTSTALTTLEGKIAASVSALQNAVTIKPILTQYSVASANPMMPADAHAFDAFLAAMTVEVTHGGKINFRKAADHTVATTVSATDFSHVAGTAKFAHLTDVHLYLNSLGTTGQAFENYLASDRKMLAQSEETLQVVVKNLEATPVDFVIVSGDLTKDGEQACHQKFASYLDQLRGTNIRTYVIPGNHDINNPHAASFAGDASTPIANLSPTAFPALYRYDGYADAIERDPASLSYVTEPVEGVWLFGLDSCEYEGNLDAGAPTTAGRLRAATLTWLDAKLADAKAKGKVVLGMEHHGVVEHFGGQSVLFPDYLLEDYGKVSAELAQEGLNVMFTGHFHAQDVSTQTWALDGGADAGQLSITDIETGSLVTYPVPYRIIDLANRSLSITSNRVTSIPSQADFTAYSKQFVYKSLVDLATTMLTAPVAYGGFGLDATTAAVLAPTIAEALTLHYAGDETIAQLSTDSQTLLTTLLGSTDAKTKGLGMLIAGVCTDLKPADNTVTVPVP